MNYKKNQFVNCQTFYLKEIGSIPLLTTEEERKCGIDLKKINNVSIVIKEVNSSCIVYNIDLRKLFVNLINCNNYEKILKILLDYYSKKESDKKIADVLRKYQNLCKKLNRPLNIEELKAFDVKEMQEPDKKEKLQNVNKVIDYTKINIIEEKKLIEEIKDLLAYKCAYDKMLEANLRLVVTIAKKYSQKYKKDIFELISEGNIGLMTAIGRFDVDKDRRLSTYATFWINQKIKKFIINDEKVRLPVGLFNKIEAFKVKYVELQKKYGFQLTEEQVAEKLNISVELLNYYLQFRDAVSLDKPIFEFEDVTLHALYPDKDNFEDELMEKFLRSDIQSLFEVLSDRERDVILSYFNFKINGHVTLEDLGKKYGITRERARQIKANALAKMKRRVEESEECEELIHYVKNI